MPATRPRPPRLLALLLVYAALAFVVFMPLARGDADLGWAANFLMAVWVALVTVVIEERDSAGTQAYRVTRTCLVPATVGWLYLVYQGLTLEPRQPAYLWYPSLCLACFLAPALVRRVRRR